MITLTIDLPETYALTAIHARHNGNWCVTVHRAQPIDHFGQVHSTAEHADIAEAARQAVAGADAKITMLNRQRTEQAATLPRISISI